MKKNSLLNGILKVIPAIALVVGTATVSQACVVWFHQPKVPEAMKKD